MTVTKAGTQKPTRLRSTRQKVSIMSAQTEQSVINCENIRSYQAEAYVDRLIKLEAALEKQRNATRFYTPSAPIIGLNATFTSPYNIQSNQETHEQSQIYDDDVVIEGEIEEEYIDEYQDMSGSELVDRMQELEDSTEEP